MFAYTYGYVLYMSPDHSLYAVLMCSAPEYSIAFYTHHMYGVTQHYCLLSAFRLVFVCWWFSFTALIADANLWNMWKPRMERTTCNLLQMPYSLCTPVRSNIIYSIFFLFPYLSWVLLSILTSSSFLVLLSYLSYMILYI